MLDQLVNYNPPAPVLHNVDLLSCFRDQLLRLFNLPINPTISHKLYVPRGNAKNGRNLVNGRPRLAIP